MKLAITAALLALSVSASADQFVNGYIKKDGTYVAPYVRSTPNNSQYDNYSTQGNVNPYTGQRGTESNTDNGNYAPKPTPYHLRRSGY